MNQELQQSAVTWIICAIECMHLFDYTDRWGKQTEQRKLRPYQLVLDDGVCYLFGFDELRNAERIFSLVRMRNAVVTDEAFELP